MAFPRSAPMSFVLQAHGPLQQAPLALDRSRCLLNRLRFGPYSMGKPGPSMRRELKLRPAIVTVHTFFHQVTFVGQRQHSTFRSSDGCSILAVVANQVVRRTIVTEFWFGFGLDLRDVALRQDLTQLHAPLVEGIDIPNYALGEHRVFVERHQFPQGFRCQSFSQDRVRRTIALENAVRNQPAWSAFRRDLLGSLAERQRLGLRADVGNEHVVMPAKWIERLNKSDEVARDEPSPLVNQL